MCREKPNGSVRIILNLSSPEGMSVHDGINSDDFPAVMSSTEKWLEVLNKAGRGAEMVKIDWADAYKQLRVRKEDLPLQWFSWLERLAKVVLDLVIRKANFKCELVCQHLDDVCAAAAKGTGAAEEFDRSYQEIAA